MDWNSKWDREFLVRWCHRTKYFDFEDHMQKFSGLKLPFYMTKSRERLGSPHKEEYDHLCQYDGIDWSVDNQWFEFETEEFCVGAPYRKEVCPDGCLRILEHISFKINNGVVVEVPRDWMYYIRAVTIMGETIEVGRDWSMHPPEIVERSLYNEIGLQY